MGSVGPWARAHTSVHRVASAFTAIASLACLVLTATPAAAAPVIDQQSGGTPNQSLSSAPLNQVGQSFTAGFTGQLTRLDVSAVGVGTPIGSLSVSIFRTSAGRPTGPALTTEVLDASAVPAISGTLSIEFTARPSVTAGTQYAFVLVPQTGLLNITLVAPGLYAGGESLDNGPNSWAPVMGVDGDLVFTTYVDPAASGGEAPPPVLQQFGRPASGTCADAAPITLNWGGTGSGGRGESWAQWINSGRGGAVCTRTLVYSTSQSRWIVG